MAMIKETITWSTGTAKLKYTFTDEDTLKIAQDMARALADQHAAEDELKSIQTQIKSKIALAVAAANAAASKISTGHEYRDVETEVEKNFETGNVTTIRKDTGEVIDVRPLTSQERQAELPIGGAR